MGREVIENKKWIFKRSLKGIPTKRYKISL
jgi:hypothetical protein